MQNIDEIPTEIYSIKIITAGDGGVGKTTLLQRYVEGVFSPSTKLTIGVEFFLKKVYLKEILGDKLIKFQLWDFGGQDRFRFLQQDYAKGASGALLLYDLTRPSTLNHIDEWLGIIRKFDANLPILFLGTKLDLVDEKLLNDAYPLTLKEKHNFIDYLKISSKTGERVEEAFEILAKEIVSKR